MHGGHRHFQQVPILVNMSEGNIGELSSIRPAQLRQLHSCNINNEADQRCTPRLSTCAVARKSPVGEKVRLVAMLPVRKASTNCPVGMSYVRMTASIEVAMSHLESAEKVYTEMVNRKNLQRQGS